MYHSNKDEYYIFQEITGCLLGLDASVRAGIVLSLFFINLLTIVYLLEVEILDNGQFRREIGNLTLLFALFFCTPLLIGFGVYFLLLLLEYVSNSFPRSQKLTEF